MITKQKCENCPVEKNPVLLHKVVLQNRKEATREIVTVCDDCLEGYSKDDNFEYWSNH
jgi:hypothetical protein